MSQHYHIRIGNVHEEDYDDMMGACEGLKELLAKLEGKK